MIGIRARGFHHLIRVAKNLKSVEMFFKYDITNVENAVALYIDANVVKNPYMPNASDYLIILNRVHANVRINSSHFAGTKYNDLISLYITKFGLNHAYIVPVDKTQTFEDSMRFSEMVIAPNGFSDMYGGFIEANKKMLPNATRFAEVNSGILRYMYAITDGSKNFFFWAVNAYFKQGVHISTLEKIMAWNENYGTKAKELKKGSITAYTGQREIVSLMSEIASIRNEKRANDVMNMFNTAQKKALKSFSLSARDRETLSKFGKLSGKKKLNFIKKMSSVFDAAEILKQMAFLSDVHFEWKKESLLEYIDNNENIDCDIILDKDDIVLLKVKDYETVKRLTKATNWCISKDKKYWNEYVEFNPNATQYIIFDFSKKEDDNHSIVGFTSVYNRGITNAHDFENHDMMKAGRNRTPNGLNNLLSKFANSGSIYSVLERDGIDLSLVVTYEPSKFKWNRESAFELIEECIDSEDYYILSDFGNMVAILTENDDIKYFIGDAYVDGRDNGGDAHILFMDFEKNQNDPNRLIFGVISYDSKVKGSKCPVLFNSRYERVSTTFDCMIEQYGLPYDIICRSNDLHERFATALANCDIRTIDALLKEKGVDKIIKSHENIESIFYALQTTIITHNSFDLFDLFASKYDMENDVISASHVSTLLNYMFSNLIEIGHREPALLIVPSNGEISDFYHGKCRDYSYAQYIFYYIGLMKLMDCVRNASTYNNVLSRIIDFGKPCDLSDLVISRICENHDIFKPENIRTLQMVLACAKNDRTLNALKLAFAKASPSLVLPSTIISAIEKKKVSTTEMWVRAEDGGFTIVNEAIKEPVHATNG